MSEKILIFGGIVIDKKIFYKRKHPFNINNKDINKMLVSNKGRYGKKGFFEYFIGYRSIYGIIALYIKLPQLSGCVKCFDETKVMSFVTEGNKLIEAYNAVKGKISSLMKKMA